ncbi:MAG: HAD family hydrolase [Cardiobacteriaceae bacterium]|nr:HAD family hydrolase [Cardiobacteriaceae bacterium]
MSDIKIIFFDIDNTLCRLGKIPDEHRVLLKQLQQQGIKLAIATGRSINMLPQDIEDLFQEGIFCALISNNGQYNLVHQEVIGNYPLSKALNQQVVDLCMKHQLVYQQAGLRQIALSQHLPHYDRISLMHAETFIIDANFHQENPVYQLSVFLPENQEAIEFENELSALGFNLARWCGDGADVLPKNMHKAVGLADVLKALGISHEQAMAFGDGSNDPEMLAFAGIGVCMGDGDERAKAAADYITGTIEEHGLQSALRHFGVLA